MDEQMSRRDFEEWADCEGFHLSSYTEDGCKKYAADHTQTAWWAWRESARRADRKARIECAEICERMTEHYSVADDCADEIRATIKEEST